MRTLVTLCNNSEEKTCIGDTLIAASVIKMHSYPISFPLLTAGWSRCHPTTGKNIGSIKLNTEESQKHHVLV